MPGYILIVQKLQERVKCISKKILLEILYMIFENMVLNNKPGFDAKNYF